MDTEKTAKEGGKEKKKAATKKPKKKPAKKKAAAKKPAKKAIKKEPQPVVEKEEVKEVVREVKKEEKKASTSTPSKKPITFTAERKKKKSSSKMGVFFFFLLIVLFGAVAIGMYYQNESLMKQTETSTQTLREDVNSEVASLKSRLQMLTQELEKQKEEDNGLMQYVNEDLGIAFDYPKELGEVQLDSTEQVVDPEIPAEQLMMVTFSNNPDVWLLLTSAGYDDQAGIAYLGGEPNLPSLCSNPLDVTIEGYCDFVSVATQDTVEVVSILGEEENKNVMMRAYVNLPEASVYSGATIALGLGTPPMTGRNLFAPSESSDDEASMIDYLRNIIKEENLSLITKQNIEAYNAIRDSFKLVP